MYKRTYLSPEEKIQAAEEYLGGIGSLNQTAKKWEVHRSTFQKWLLNYETDKAKLVEETVWQRIVAGNLGFDAETHYPETMMELDLGAEKPKWELRSADELRREGQKGHQSLREKYGKG